MGVKNNNAIIATTWSEEKATAFQSWIDQLTSKERELFVHSGSWVNRNQSFALLPDGSKEGWSESDAGDALRDRVVARLEEDNYEDGSSPWDWVEVGFGEYGQKVLRGNCKNCYSNCEYFS